MTVIYVDYRFFITYEADKNTFNVQFMPHGINSCAAYPSEIQREEIEFELNRIDKNRKM